MKSFYFYLFVVLSLFVLPVLWLADKLDNFMDWYMDATGIENE
jgi:hypothetical protein